MYIKIHRSQAAEVVAVCDQELIGKNLKDEKYNITIQEHFYKGEIRKEEEVIAILKDATNCNIIGEKAVRAGIKAGIISKESVIRIAGIPHAQVYTS